MPAARDSIAERSNAPPGAETAVATGASGEVAAHPQRAALRSRPRRSPSASDTSGDGAGPGGRRNGVPAARRAATIAPADVPTKDSTARRSAPDWSSMPARTPVIQASPMTPPPARTRTSGATKTGTRLSLRRPAMRRPPSSLYAIAYVCIVAVAEEIHIHIGPRVRALREAMDLSLRDLAERSGVSAPMLSQVERGETSPTLPIASRIAAGLELRLASSCASTRPGR